MLNKCHSPWCFYFGELFLTQIFTDAYQTCSIADSPAAAIYMVFISSVLSNYKSCRKLLQIIVVPYFYYTMTACSNYKTNLLDSIAISWPVRTTTLRFFMLTQLLGQLLLRPFLHNVLTTRTGQVANVLSECVDLLCISKIKLEWTLKVEEYCFGFRRRNGYCLACVDSHYSLILPQNTGSTTL